MFLMSVVSNFIITHDFDESMIKLIITSVLMEVLSMFITTRDFDGSVI